TAPEVEALAAKRGFNLKAAQEDWKSTVQHIQTANSSQQLRLRQAVSELNSQIPLIESLYEQYKAKTKDSKYKIINAANLEAAAQSGGELGALATSLRGQIGLIRGNLSQIIIGGYAPTNEAIKLTGDTLSGNWDQPTFERALKTMRSDVQIRM